MQLESLKKLFIMELQDVYSAENQLLEGLQLMADAASNQELKQAFQQHLQETQGQIGRLEQIFSQLGEEPGGETCEAMQGLLAEAKEVLEMQADPDVLDAALIGCAQKNEHYEIASYGTLVTYANMMDETQVADLLQATLDEEYATDDKLTALAESTVNIRAQKGGS
jgi:ferritin-like metal-binding protein YciE